MSQLIDHKKTPKDVSPSNKGAILSIQYGLINIKLDWAVKAASRVLWAADDDYVRYLETGVTYFWLRLDSVTAQQSLACVNPF